MADKDLRLPYNVSGKFYVTSDCIDCDVCRGLAPDYFKLNEDEGFSYVFQQPSGELGVEQCEEAMEGCPVDAIGNDG